MEILGKILGSQARVKIMRLFLLNKDTVFSNKEIAKRSRVSLDAVRREVKLLESIGFLRKRSSDVIFDYTFRYAKEIEGLLITTNTLDQDTILNIFKKSGKIKLLLTAGIFIQNKDSRVDLLIVGDSLKKGHIEEGVRKMEAELGRELAYAVFDTKEFIYRINMYDKLIRDILDFPNDVLVQAKELSTQVLKKA